MPLESGICEPWPLNESCFSVPEGTDQALIDNMQRVASEYLWTMTGRRLGPDCPVTVRPCRRGCADQWIPSLGFWPAGYNGSPWIPYIDASGVYRNASLCGCKTDCNCGAELCVFELAGPVYDIVSITIDGETVDPATYAIQGSGTVIRLDDGEEPRECWPDCQDMSLPDGEEGTFVVTYRTGVRLPAMASVAVSKLTEHMIKGCSGGGCGCGAGTRQNLQRLSRQGVDLEFANPQELFKDGRTGIDQVDWFIRAYNPQGLASPLRVLSPDAPRYPKIRRTAI